MAFDADYAANAQVVAADELAQIVDAAEACPDHHLMVASGHLPRGASVLLGLIAAVLAAFSASAL